MDIFKIGGEGGREKCGGEKISELDLAFSNYFGYNTGII